MPGGEFVVGGLHSHHNKYGNIGQVPPQLYPPSANRNDTYPLIQPYHDICQSFNWQPTCPLNQMQNFAPLSSSYAQQALNWNMVNLASIQQALNAIQQQQAQQHHASLQQFATQSPKNGRTWGSENGFPTRLNNGGAYAPLNADELNGNFKDCCQRDLGADKADNYGSPQLVKGACFSRDLEHPAPTPPPSPILVSRAPGHEMHQVFNNGEIPRTKNRNSPIKCATGSGNGSKGSNASDRSAQGSSSDDDQLQIGNLMLDNPMRNRKQMNARISGGKDLYELPEPISPEMEVSSSWQRKDTPIPNAQVTDEALMKSACGLCCVPQQTSSPTDDHLPTARKLDFSNYSGLHESSAIMGNGSMHSNECPNSHVNVTLSPRNNIDLAAKLHRHAASSNDATCTWSGALPPRSSSNPVYSCKVFLGGVPWDITADGLQKAFRQFGAVRIEFPGSAYSPRNHRYNLQKTRTTFIDEHTQCPGYVYAIFESDKQVKAMLQQCSRDQRFNPDGEYYYKVPSRKLQTKEVQVIPWILSDGNYLVGQCCTGRLDNDTTVFVGALHGMLNAEGLARVMNDLFGNVLYAGIDTDKYKYPIGSGRVTFGTHKSYMKAVNAAFVEIKTQKFVKKVQIDPYLEECPCQFCGEDIGPYFCRNQRCFKYYCEKCWSEQHNLMDASAGVHHPLTRNSKNNGVCTTVIGQFPINPTRRSSCVVTR